MENKSAMDVFMAQQAMPAPEAEPADLLMDVEESDEKKSYYSKEEANGGAGAGVEMDMPSAPSPMRMMKAKRAPSAPIPVSSIKTSEQLLMEKEPINIRETGFWLWRRMIVPPNVYVVHTRINRKEPVTMGLGISFRYIPAKDSFQVIPASIQTIGVVANCISREKQGINVLAYVQWQIEDISVAYRKIDFSDRRDPLAIVNAQLREQAEAAIKDKIATMSVEEVLTDKAPIISELTTRLKAVTEEQQSDGKTRYEGLGIMIITVQIREAIVCSQTLWKDLQSPFRYQQAKAARISYLESQDEINIKELETRRQVEIREAETNVEIERIKQKKETEAQELRLNEESARCQQMQNSRQQVLRLEEKTQVAEIESRERLLAKDQELQLKRELEVLQNQDRKDAEEASLGLEAQKRSISFATEQAAHKSAEDTRLLLRTIELKQQEILAENDLKKTQLEFQGIVQAVNDRLQAASLEANLARERMSRGFELEMAEKRNLAANLQEEAGVRIDRQRREIENLIGDKLLVNELIERLPEIASALPKPDELKIIQTGDGKADFTETLAAFISKMLAVCTTLGIALPGLGKKDPEA